MDQCSRLSNERSLFWIKNISQQSLSLNHQINFTIWSLQAISHKALTQILYLNFYFDWTILSPPSDRLFSPKSLSFFHIFIVLAFLARCDAIIGIKVLWEPMENCNRFESWEQARKSGGGKNEIFLGGGKCVYVYVRI